MNKKKKIGIIITVVLALWLAIGIIDFVRVESFNKPIFCIGTNTYDDGGSGHYVGLGYSFDIKGNFMPEDELPGVTEYSYQIFGIHIKSGTRD